MVKLFCLQSNAFFLAFLHLCFFYFTLQMDTENQHVQDVWASNLEQEMAKIRDIIEKYPYVAMVPIA
jgi:hypothetical protein